jgi:hypothetical protein
LIKRLSEQDINKDKAFKQAARIREQTGIDLAQEAGDIGAVNRITSAKPAGAKWVGLGGIAGTALGTALTRDAMGGTVGGLLGGLAGGGWERYGGRSVKWAIDRGTGLRKITKAIADNRIVSTPWAGLKKIDPSYVSAAHYALYNNDPEYRAWVDGLEE